MLVPPSEHLNAGLNMHVGACKTILKRFGNAGGLKCVLAFLTNVDVSLLWSDGDLI